MNRTHLIGAVFVTLIALYTMKHGDLIAGLFNAMVVTVVLGIVYSTGRWLLGFFSQKD